MTNISLDDLAYYKKADQSDKSGTSIVIGESLNVIQLRCRHLKQSCIFQCFYTMT